MEAFLSSSICLENVSLCQCLKQFQSKPLTSAIKIFCSSQLKILETAAELELCPQDHFWGRGPGALVWLGRNISDSYSCLQWSPCVYFSSLCISLSRQRSCSCSDLTPRPGNWDSVHPMGLGRCEPFTMKQETRATL